MSNKFFQSLSVLGLILTSTLVVNEVKAEEIKPNNVKAVDPLGVNELIDRSFFSNSGSFAEQVSIEGQLNLIFGFENFPEGSYPENNIVRDSILLNAVVKDYFKQLEQREPTIRTRDLPNPFTSSLQQNPSYLGSE